MYNIYSIFENLLGLSLVIFLITIFIMFMSPSIFYSVKSKKMYKILYKIQTTNILIFLISIAVTITSLFGWFITDGMASQTIKNTIADYFNADIKLHDNQVIVDNNEYYNFKYDDKKDEIILDKLNSDTEIVIKDVFNK